MPFSRSYNTLQTRLHQLESHLLPAIDPTLNYSDRDRDLTRSYCLLCHAEIEAYIEAIILDVAKQAYTKWFNNKQIISPIIFHLAYTYRHEIGKKEPPYSMVVKSFKNLEVLISSNNGIKESNTTNLLKPIGFEMDSTLQSTLNDFGKTRGQIAHTSFQTQQPLDPATEKSNIAQILSALQIFDADIVTYEQHGTLNRTPVNMQWGRKNFWQRLGSLINALL
jgi:hypothetical protein